MYTPGKSETNVSILAHCNNLLVSRRLNNTHSPTVLKLIVVTKSTFFQFQKRLNNTHLYSIETIIVVTKLQIKLNVLEQVSHQGKS